MSVHAEYRSYERKRKNNCREYGNGLQKFEPNDINKANIIDLDRIDQLTEERIIELYRHYKQSEIEKYHDTAILDKLNKIFLDNFAI